MGEKSFLKNTGIFLLFGGPSLFTFTAVVFIPFVIGLYFTFTNWSVATFDSRFTGFGNYVRIFEDKAFVTSIWFTLKYVLFCFIFANLIAFVVALALTGSSRRVQFLRGGFFTPNLIGGVVLGYLWSTLFGQVLPYVGKNWGWDIFVKSWIGDPDKAFWAIVIASVWQLAGYLMIIYIAGISAVPKDVLEAASIDGANSFAKIRRIILPLTIPAFVICFFISIVRSFLAYDIILTLTKGGPFNSTEIVTYHIVKKAFISNDYGAGQAGAIILFLIVALIALTQSYIMKKMEVEA